MPLLWSGDEPRGDASERCCQHPQGEEYRSPLDCRRWYSLLFVTSEPFCSARCFLLDRVGSLCLREDIERCTVLPYPNRTKSGFYAYTGFLKFSDKVRLVAEDWLQLEKVCTPEGGATPIIFPHSCCEEKTRLIDECLKSNLLDQDGSGSRREYKMNRSPEDEVKELAESIVNIIGGSCHCV